MASLHHHELRGAPLGSQTDASSSRVKAAARTTCHASLPAHRRQSMALTVHAAANLEVVVGEHLPAVHASKAAWMELLLRDAGGGLEVLAFDAAMAAVTAGAVLLVVVLLAVGQIGDDVEVGGGEELVAGLAGEAGLVPAASQTAVGGLDGLAFDNQAAATTG